MANSLKQEILDELDKSYNVDYDFLFDPGHGYFALAGSRINLFKDSSRWAIVFEKSGFSNRAGRLEIELHYYGNCLSNLDRAGLDDRFVCNGKFIELLKVDDICHNSEGEYELLNPVIKQVEINGETIQICHDINKYKELGIEAYRSKPGIEDFVRYVWETQKDALLAKEKDLRTCLPDDLPILGVIDEWYHDEQIPYEAKPSDFETYQLIADVVAEGDLNLFKPSLPPNNHWRSWPESGGI